MSMKKTNDSIDILMILLLGAAIAWAVIQSSGAAYVG